MLCTLLCLLPFKAGAQSPVGIAVGGDNLTRLVWNNPDGSIALWKIAADGSVAAQNSYGPYPGWSASAVGMGPDSFARVLCTHPADGQMSLWRVDPSSPASFTAANYGPYSGWVAASLAVGGSNAPRVLWNHPADSQMSLWNITPDTTFTQGTYGPYSGYRASFVASGPNSIARVLWTYSDGSISFWNGVPDAGGFSFQNYGPYPGWSAAALAVDSGNAPRLLWSHPADSTISLWKVAGDGTFTQQTYTDPAGYSPVALAAGTGGDVRLLWSNGQGGAQVWTIAAGGAYTSKTYPAPSALALSPTSITNGGTSTGTVTLSSPAPAGGAAVSLTSSNTAAATVPASVTVTAGQTSATFTVTGKSVSSTTAVTITASYSGVSQTASLSVTAPAPVLTSIVVSPSSAGVSLNGMQQFTAIGKDQNGNAVSPQPSFTWSVVSGGVGSISGAGLYSAGATAGTATVKASSSSVSSTAAVTVTNAAPTVAAAASASPSPATGKTTTLSVQGTDDGGVANLTYTWATTGTPPAAVTFSANATNAAQSTTATFTKAGAYSFVVTIKDAGGLTATSAVTVAVNPTLTSIVVSPASASVATGGTQQFGASAKDQFGAVLSAQPSFAWSVGSGGVGSISTAGLYSAGSNAGSATVKAASGSVSGTAAVTVASAPTLTLTAAATGSSKITLYWNGVAGASGYNVYRATVSGGPYSLVASSVTAANAGPGMTDAFMYSDASGLTTGTEYFYVVRAVQGGAESVQSNEASDIPQAGAVPWDTGDPVQILNAETAQLNAILPPDIDPDTGDFVPAEVGLLTAQGPDGVIYEGADADGNPASSYASPGYYDAANSQIVYNDGSTQPVQPDTSTAASATASTPSFAEPLDGFFLQPRVVLPPQDLNHSFDPTKGIYREVLSQPGYVGLSTTQLIFPSPSTSSGSVHLSASGKSGQTDSADIYTGGRLVNVNGVPVSGSALDAGLTLMTSNPVTDPAWQPTIQGQANKNGVTTIDRPQSTGGGLNGNQRILLYGDAGNPLQMSFVTGGQDRRYLQGRVALHFRANYRLVIKGAARKILNPNAPLRYGSVTFTSAQPMWNYRNGQGLQIKRVNSIAQNIPAGVLQLQNNSYLYGCAWGGDQSDDRQGKLYQYAQYSFSIVDWDQSPYVTYQAGSYPGPVDPKYKGYVSFRANAPFHSEDKINLSTTHDSVLSSR